MLNISRRDYFAAEVFAESLADDFRRENASDHNVAAAAAWSVKAADVLIAALDGPPSHAPTETNAKLEECRHLVCDLIAALANVRGQLIASATVQLDETRKRLIRQLQECSDNARARFEANCK